METVLDNYQQAVLSNATVSASGSSMVLMDFGHKEVSLVVNITAAPTGTTPSVTFTIAEVDPGNETTLLGISKTGSALTAAGTQILTLPVTYGGSIQVSWTVTGTTPSFTGVYATVVNKGTAPVIYDQAGNGPVAVKPASTAVAATDPALAVGISPNSPLPAGTATIGAVNQGTPATLANAWAEKLTDGTNGPVAVKPGSTASTAADPALVVALSPNTPTPNFADLTATGTLGALNTAITLVTAGANSVGFQLAAGTLIGTIVPEVSFDSGNTWNTTYFDQLGGNKVTSIVFSSANTATAATIIGVGGSGQFRVRVSAYTSGTATGTVRATDINDPSSLFEGVVGGAVQPPSATQVAGWDTATTTFRVPVVKAASTAIAATDQALAVGLHPSSPLPAGTNVIGMIGFSDTQPGSLTITSQDTGSTSSVVSNGQVLYTGTPTTGSTAVFALSAKESVKVQVTGTWTGTLQVENSIDGGVTWFASIVHQTGTYYSSAVFTNNFDGGLNSSGCTQARVRAIAAWTGTATVIVTETSNANSIYVASPVLLKDTTTQSVTNTIKAASVPAVSGDTALVVDSRAPATATVTSVTATTSSTSIKAANTNRKGLFLFNTSTSALYLLFGSGTASTSLGGYSVIVWPQTLYELPTQCGAVYNGALTGIWGAANGGVAVTEVTP